MRMKTIVAATILAVMSVAVSAQTKTITNADLEKYKQKRLAAEKELRENYRELGFPSPEERAAAEEKNRRELAEQAERLRAYRVATQQPQVRNVYRSLPVVETNNYRGYYAGPRYGNFSRGYAYGGYFYSGGIFIGGRWLFKNRVIQRRGVYRRGVRRGVRRTNRPGFIQNRTIRDNWRRQSRSMRETYRNNRRPAKRKSNRRGRN